MSLTAHPLWSEIAPFIRIEVYAKDGGHKKPRFRLEFSGGVTQAQKRKWIDITTPCAACGSTIHPVRERKPVCKAPNIGRIYIAPCCPLSVNAGCSRGNAAHDEYLAIRKTVENTP